MMRSALLAFAALPAMSFTAFAYCAEPSSEPWCLSDDDSFRTESGFDDCRWQVERFVDDVGDYVDCLEDEKDDHRRGISDHEDEINDLREQIDDLFNEISDKAVSQEEAVELGNEAVRRFNCGANSGEACW